MKQLLGEEGGVLFRHPVVSPRDDGANICRDLCERLLEDIPQGQFAAEGGKVDIPHFLSVAKSEPKVRRI